MEFKWHIIIFFRKNSFDFEDGAFDEAKFFGDNIKNTTDVPGDSGKTARSSTNDSHNSVSQETDVSRQHVAAYDNNCMDETNEDYGSCASTPVTKNGGIANEGVETLKLW